MRRRSTRRPGHGLRDALRRGLWLLVAFVVGGVALRAWQTGDGLPLEPWHTFVPEEPGVAALDAATWPDYLRAEDRVFASVLAHVTQTLDVPERAPYNRYFDGSPVHPARFERDWNRSFVLEPDGPPKGVAVLLHGLTDSPYSVRHLAALYRARGFVAVAIRMPAHGTVPAALTRIEWEDWLAAARLAVREARRRVPAPAPFHLVGYSNGGALAVKYTLDALEDGRLARPDRVVLVSPMIGVPSYARFAGMAGWPAVLPAFAKAAWIELWPEYNPFKYNSFPVNGVRQSYRLTRALQEQLVRAAQDHRLTRMPPILAFQSVVDDTVSTRAVVAALFAHLPANGSELVLFDLNRSIQFGPLLQPGAAAALADLLPGLPRDYGVSIVANAADGGEAMVERRSAAGAETEVIRPLALAFPPGVYSLSHVALPFPVTDALYGLQPDPAEDYGIRLGTLGLRGERRVLMVDPEALGRLNCNPFYPYLAERIEAGIEGP
jgi:alpha-beta hydrolase superfamily lysophospholipase